MVNDRRQARGAGPGPRWSDLVAAAGQRPDGMVLDGELVVWDSAVGRLSFQALQRRRPRPRCPGPGRPVADRPDA
ncbi:hypothetical protein OHA84_01805 [Streptomyces sp. NBC_00513]|uniref:hypothetical protein n=1 Tax=unclassified Streptomyces TaxID=2593676 RepID=UPI002255D8BE|nr:hypothetical protein [Streptomyces sp. NBC_00424]MCX5079102.1 hypothetical protein [Streptomyces sp. NBC_00424]WUD39332.1 hypothetical protein OHA84_01805 [Streptomyces sp. NBC_00513]